MPSAVTLVLDDATADVVAGLRHALLPASGGPETQPPYPPHLTLAVLTEADAITTAEEGILALADTWSALPVTLAGIGVFPGPPAVVWLVPVVTQRLLACHAALHALLVPFKVDPHTDPAAWVPHVTLIQGTPMPGHAVELLSSLWAGPIDGRADRLELVRFHPVEVMRTRVLPLG